MAAALSSKAFMARQPAAAVRLPGRPAARAAVMQPLVAMAKPTSATEFR